MATTTDTKTNTGPRAEEARSAGAVMLAPPRLAYPPEMMERHGVDESRWRALVEAVWPLARTPGAVDMALSYCKARNLDPFKRPVHIVPVWNSALQREVETCWAGISEIRTTAFRTNQYAGQDKAVWGEVVEATFTGRTRKGDQISVTMKYPEWVELTIYRKIDGEKLPFHARCYFVEWFGQRQGMPVPNERWQRAPFQMLEKCVEAAALRKAFPEEAEYSAEEMEGQVIDQGGNPAGDTPPRPTRDQPRPGGAQPREEKPIEPFAIMDDQGVESLIVDETTARDALAELLKAAPDERSVDGIWESNGEFMTQLRERGLGATAEYLHKVYTNRLKALEEARKSPAAKGNTADSPTVEPRQGNDVAGPSESEADSAATPGATPPAQQPGQQRQPGLGVAPKRSEDFYRRESYQIVPTRGPDNKVLWSKWETVMVETANLCQNLEELGKLDTHNAAFMADMQTMVPKGYAKVRAAIKANFDRLRAVPGIGGK